MQRTEYEGPPEREMIPCASCRELIATFWAPGGGGILRGSYVLIADTVWHESCWDKQTAELWKLLD